jgi:hypothetical protein
LDGQKLEVKIHPVSDHPSAGARVFERKRSAERRLPCRCHRAVARTLERTQGVGESAGNIVFILFYPQIWELDLILGSSTVKVRSWVFFQQGTGISTWVGQLRIPMIEGGFLRPSSQRCGWDNWVLWNRYNSKIWCFIIIFPIELAIWGTPLCLTRDEAPPTSPSRKQSLKACQKAWSFSQWPSQWHHGGHNINHTLNRGICYCYSIYIYTYPISKKKTYKPLWMGVVYGVVFTTWNIYEPCLGSVGFWWGSSHHIPWVGLYDVAMALI